MAVSFVDVFDKRRYLFRNPILNPLDPRTRSRLSSRFNKYGNKSEEHGRVLSTIPM